MKSRRLRAYDRNCLNGQAGLIGVDEAGRGALAGPVVAAAVAARSGFYDTDWCKRNASRINDSKLLSPEEREELYSRLRWLERTNRIFIGVGVGSVKEIEEHNILGATQIAMKRAMDEILSQAGISRHDPDPLFAETASSSESEERLSQWIVLVDGKPMRALGFKHHGIVKGDSKSLCIAMASIIAKVTRDRQMMALDCQYPHYHFASSKGYATPLHREAIIESGPTPIHRSLFLRKILEEKTDDEQVEFGFEEIDQRSTL